MCAVCGCSGHVHLDGEHEHVHSHSDPAHGHGQTQACAHVHHHPGAHEHSHDHLHVDPLADGRSIVWHESAPRSIGEMPHLHLDASDREEAEELRRRMRWEAEILSMNDRIAQENRDYLAGVGAVAFNVIGSPGSGKTTLLEQIIRLLGREHPIAVLEGDQETDLDAERIRRLGVQVFQINTGSGCHLDARMVGRSLPRLDLRPGSLIFVENVGNLVCPALFDLGEHAKILVTAVTEGPDKPLKYPHIFREAHVLALTKTDLLPHLDVGLHAYVENARRINPHLVIFPVSSTRNLGMRPLLDWIVRSARAERVAFSGA